MQRLACIVTVCDRLFCRTMLNHLPVGFKKQRMPAMKTGLDFAERVDSHNDQLVPAAVELYD